MLQPRLDPPDGALIAEPIGVAAAGARVNDFAFKIGTVNGTGSASANSLLMQAIFRMGIPISGKNVFPSNIQGLPPGTRSGSARRDTPRGRPYSISSW